MGLLNPLKSYLPIKWLVRVLLAFLAWQIVMFVWVRPRDYTEAEQVAIRHACEQARVLSVEALEVPFDPPVKLGATHLLNDPSGVATDLLKTNLASVAQFELPGKSVVRKFLSDITDALQDATSFEEVAFAAHQVELDVIACGRVEDVHEDDGIGYAVLDYRLYDLSSGSWILKEQIQADSRTPRVAWIQRYWKLLAAILLIALIPWLSFPLSEKVAERNSNTASAALLAGFVAIDLLLLWWAGLFGASVAVPVVGVLLVAGYNLWACDVIAKKVE